LGGPETDADNGRKSAVTSVGAVKPCAICGPYGQLAVDVRIILRLSVGYDDLILAVKI
jgi:hypothetical protein